MAKRPPLLRSLGSFYTHSMSIPAPFRLKAVNADRMPSYWNEKITLEPDISTGTQTGKRISLQPDMGDQRESASKALPRPPITPNRIIQKYRISAALVGSLGLVSFVLSLLLLLAGKEPGYLADAYMVELNTTQLGKDLIRFDTASSTTPASPTSTASSSSNPLDFLNPLSTVSPLNPNNPDNPLSQLTNSLEPIIGNLTDSLNDGLGNAVNQVVGGLFDQAGVRGVYSVYLNRVCEKVGGSAERCLSFTEVGNDLRKETSSIQSFLVLGPTNISVPLLEELSHSGGGLFDTLDSVRRALLAFVIVSVIGSGSTFLISIPSVIFPASRLLVYASVFTSHLSSLSAFLAAVLHSVLAVGGSSILGSVGKALNVTITPGEKALTFVWVSWALIVVAAAYWAAVWFVEVRKWSFSRRLRTEDERGNWKGIRGEICRDMKGPKSQ